MYLCSADILAIMRMEHSTNIKAEKLNLYFNAINFINDFELPRNFLTNFHFLEMSLLHLSFNTQSGNGWRFFIRTRLAYSSVIDNKWLNAYAIAGNEKASNDST